MDSLFPDQTSKWAAQSVKGTRKESNEDSCEFFTVIWGKEKKHVTVMIVADGISATKGGGRASQVAVDIIKSVLTEPADTHDTTSDRMAQALTLANQEILLQASQDPHLADMGTTVVMALIVDYRLYVMGLGDSRAYLIRDKQLHRLTTDHTWAQYHIDANNGSNHRVRHLDHAKLVRYLGNPSGAHIDRGIVSPDSKVKEEYIPIRVGDHVLLCSDGLHKSVAERELTNTVNNCRHSMDRAVSDLISLAQQKGETDDITAILFEVPEAATSSHSVIMAAGQPSTRLLRLLLAAAVALMLVIFQLNYLSNDSNGSDNGLTTGAEAETRSSASKPLTPIDSPTITKTPTPTARPIQSNGTIPQPNTEILPTAALPTAALPTAVFTTTNSQ